MFGASRARSESAASDAPPEPDFRALVDRNLAIAHNAQMADRLWDLILAELQGEGRRQRYTTEPRRERRV